MGESGEASANLMPLAASWALQMKTINMYFNSMAAEVLLSKQQTTGCKMPDATDDPEGAGIV